MTQADWIAVDWGTTHLRAWAMAGREVLAKGDSAKGMNGLKAKEYEQALIDIVDPWLRSSGVTPVICCGMVGSRQGWIEAPYETVPCKPASDRLIAAPTKDARLDVHLIPGLRQDTPADVMRGEETQIAGFLALNPDWDGVVCLPGTHSKWVHVSAGEVVSFQTFMTGEIFALLAGQSVLRHTVQSEDWDADTFAESITETLARPADLAARLFRLRADHLLHDRSGACARARLSGLLVGAELAASKPYWLGQQVAVIGADAVGKAYLDALSLQGVPAILAQGEAATLAGLGAARRALEPAAG